MNPQRRFVVIGVVRFHRSNHTQIVDTFGHMRKQVADFDAALAAWFEFPLRPLEEHVEVPFASLKLIDWNRLPGIREQLRLRIPRVDV